MNLPLVGNLNSAHGHLVVALALFLVFAYVEDGKFVEGPLEHLGGTGLVLAILGMVYLTMLANRA